VFLGRRAIVQKLLRTWMPPDKSRRILDVGCGTGAMLEMLQEFGKVEGLESSSAALQHCRNRLGSKVELHEGSLPGGLPEDRRYDVITAFDVLEHIQDSAAALSQVRQALAPTGYFVCTVPAHQFLWGPHDVINHHFRRYGRTQLVEELTLAGFRVRWISYFNSVLFAPIAFCRLWNNATRRKRAPQSDLDVCRFSSIVFYAIFFRQSVLFSPIFPFRSVSPWWQ